MKTALILTAVFGLIALGGCCKSTRHGCMARANAAASPLPTASGNLPPDVAANVCGSDTRCHVEKIRNQMQGLIQHLKLDGERITEPQAKAMFETSAEVVAGLEKSLRDYESRNEAAWRK
jgi:hypothetical protein